MLHPPAQKPPKLITAHFLPLQTLLGQECICMENKQTNSTKSPAMSNSRLSTFHHCTHCLKSDRTPSRSIPSIIALLADCKNATGIFITTFSMFLRFIASGWIYECSEIGMGVTRNHQTLTCTLWTQENGCQQICCAHPSKDSDGCDSLSPVEQHLVLP
jgi:hypothetical protein